MSKFTYRIYREAWLDIDVDAENEDAADDVFFELLGHGEFNDRFRDEILEAQTNVAEVWDGGVEDGICIYRAY